MRIIFKLLILPFVFPCLAVSAQVTTNLNNQIAINDQGKFTKLYRSHIDFKLPAKSADSLLQIEKHEQSVSDNAKPFRLAVPVKVDLDIPKLTQWNYENDSAYGKFTIEADGALSLSINFDEFFLPKGTEMYVYNKNGNMITGPITEIENNVNKIWGSWVYEGELLNIEIKTPILTLSQLLLHSNNIAYGYKEVYDKVVGFGNSGSCEINVVCSLGTGWENERNTVALVLNDDGSAWCSGCMVMNTCSTNKPFFLTADHCLKGQDVSGWRFTFQAWSPTCTPSQNSNGLTFNGSSLKANYSPSDFCLVELNTTPANSSGIYYAGWTRSTTAASNTTGIHHPMGDVMKISRDNAASSKANYLSTTGNTHWLVDWDNGVTEGGSSGSPLFDQNHRIIGQLHGGYSYCGSGDLRDWYGAFDLSWTGGGTNATRLSNWLDPDNTGAMTTNTTDVNSLNIPIGTLSISGSASLCSSTESYTLNNNGVPFNGNITWTSSNPAIASATLNGNPATVTQTGSGSVTITASIVSPCYGTTSVSKEISVGLPPASNITIWNSQSSTTVGHPVGFVLGYPPAGRCEVMEADWQVSMSANIQQGDFPCGQDNGTSKNIFFLNAGTANVKARVQNVCGWSDWSTRVPIQVNSSLFKVAPNPATNTITVKGKDITELKIFDNMGNLKKQLKYKANLQQFQVNVSDLQMGIYIIEATSGQDKERQQFIIQK